MNRVFFIYLFSFVLLVISEQVPPQSFKGRRKETSEFEKGLISHSKLTKERFLKKVHFNLIMAYITGNKKTIPKELKRSHQILNLMHLFTPSGLHFSSLYFFFIPLFNFLKKRNTPIFLLFQSFICLAPLLLTGFNSIKRIGIFYWLKELKKTALNEKLKQMKNFYLFILTFILDAIKGSFLESPLSFCYSFIFLGLLFCHEDFQLKRVFFYFLGAQIILNFFSKGHFSPLGLLFGFLHTYIFSFLFPFWVSLFLIPPKIFTLFDITFFWQKSVSLFIESISFFTNITLKFEFYFSSIPLILSVFLCSYQSSKKLKYLLVTFFILIHSNPLPNFPISSFKGNFQPTDFQNLKKNKIDSVHQRKGKTIILFKSGKKCTYELKPKGVSEKCRYL